MLDRTHDIICIKVQVALRKGRKNRALLVGKLKQTLNQKSKNNWEAYLEELSEG